MKVLGLDLSLTATGAAIIEDGVVGARWLIKTKADHTDMERYDYIVREIMAQVHEPTALLLGSDGAADLVAMEGVYGSRNIEVFRRLTALQACVQYALFRSRIQYVILPPASWRTAIFGKGSKVDKERVRAAALSRLKAHTGDMDVEQVDLNVLEAFLVGLAAWKMEVGQVPKPVAKKRKKEAE